MTEIRIYKSRWQAIKMMLLCTVFVGLSVYFLRNGDVGDKTIFWKCICFFGLGYPLGLFYILDRRPQVVINEIGIFDRTLSKSVINWSVIRDAYIIEMRRQKFICLVIDEHYEPSVQKGALYKAAARFNKELGAQELNISASILAMKPENLLHLILLLKDAQPEQRKNYLTPNVSSSGSGH